MRSKLPIIWTMLVVGAFSYFLFVQSCRTSPPEPVIVEAVEIERSLEAIEADAQRIFAGPTSVRVQREGGAPVVGAIIEAGTLSELRQIGETGGDGASQVQLTESDFLVRVSTPGLIPRELAIARPIPTEMKVVLANDGGLQLRGLVLREDSTAARGAQVLAWNSQGAVNWPSRVSTAAANSDGEFSINSLDSNVQYRLAAISPEGAISTILEGVSCADTPTLHVRQVHAALVHVLDKESGGPPACSSKLFRSDRGTISLATAPKGVTSCSTRTLNFLQAFGFVPKLKNNVHTLLLAYSEPCDVRLKAWLPGYEPVSTTIDLPPLSGRIREFNVEAGRTGSDYGKVLFSCRGLAANGEGLSQRVVARILLSGNSEGFEFALGPHGRAFEVDGVPAGSYEVRMVPMHGMVTIPVPSQDAIPLSVWSGASSSLILDTAERGALRIDVSLPGGGQYDGPLNLDLVQTKGIVEGRRGVVSFAQRPYLVELLLPGTYQVSTRFKRTEAGQRVSFAGEVEAYVVTAAEAEALLGVRPVK